MSSSIRRSLAIAAVLAAAWAVPAQAERYENIRESARAARSSRSAASSSAGLVFSTRTITRTGKHELETAFFGHFQVDAVTTVTNLANGKFYTVERHSVQGHQGGPAGRVALRVRLDRGRPPFTLKDMSGETVIRERGQLRFTYLFDTEGRGWNPAPGGITLEDL